MGPEQTAPMSSLIWVHTVCYRGIFKHFSRREKQTTFAAVRVKKHLYSSHSSIVAYDFTEFSNDNSFLSSADFFFWQYSFPVTVRF